MPQVGYRKLFTDKRKLYLLINFRIEGYTYHSLASLFHCDRDTVRNECRKYGIEAVGSLVSLVRDLRTLNGMEPQIVREWAVVDGEKINQGHSYADYLKRNVPLKKLGTVT